MTTGPPRSISESAAAPSTLRDDSQSVSSHEGGSSTASGVPGVPGVAEFSSFAGPQSSNRTSIRDDRRVADKQVSGVSSGPSHRVMSFSRARPIDERASRVRAGGPSEAAVARPCRRVGPTRWVAREWSRSAFSAQAPRCRDDHKAFD